MGNLNTSQILDRVDDDDQPVGIINRRDLPSQSANFRVVHVFVFNGRKELLLQRIAAGQRSASLLGSSVAGYLEAGESYEQAAIRKTAAEIGAYLKPKLIGKLTMPDLGGTKFISLFCADAEGPFFADKRQVAGLEFRSVAAVAADLESSPENYTKTFQAVFGFYQRS